MGCTWIAGGVVETIVPADAGATGGVTGAAEAGAADAGAAVDTTVPADAGTAAAGAGVAATIEPNHAETAGQFS